MFDEFFERASELRAAGVPFATAVVVRAEKPTSGKPGDRAIVTLDGTMHGWIGGSCAQPTVVREAVRALADGTPRLIRLSPDPGSEELPEGVSEVAMTCFSGGTLDIFVEPHPPVPRLIIVGSLPVAQALAHLGKAIKYDVVAVDPTDGDAMAHADTVLRDLDRIPEYVTPLTYAVVATHGEYDEPALQRLLATSVPYVGLVASRSRGEAVLRALEQDGVTQETRARVRYPAGLDIGARRGDEIAVSIVAEIIREGRALGEIEWSSEALPAGDAAGGSDAPATNGSDAPSTTASDVSATVAAASDVSVTATDPVCRMSVEVEGALHTAEHEGRTYYFCCGGCRTKFTADPEHFLSVAGA